MRTPRFHTAGLVALVVALLLGVTAPPASAATQAQVDAAIIKGKKFLYSRQRPEGRWERDALRQGNDNNYAHMQGQTWGGYTAIATYALLAAGENPQGPRLGKAIEFLKTADITGVYAVAMRCQVWSLLPPTPEVKAMARRDATLLLSTLNVSGPGKGGWDYDDPTNQSTNPEGGRIDHSLSQYGVLGLWACDRLGVDVNLNVWTLIEATWRKHQFEDGGWAYDSSPDRAGKTGPTASMTAAGVATLFITQEYIHAGAGVTCQGNVTNDAIEKGLAYLTAHFKDARENNYMWYGIERIGVASGYKYFGTVDWYREGTDALLKTQAKDGSWDAGFEGASPIPATAFALLFLSRGRAPVIMSKLDYSPPPEPTIVIPLPGQDTPADAPGEASPNAPDEADKQAAQPKAEGNKDDAQEDEQDKAEKAQADKDAKSAKVDVHWNQRPRDLANFTDWMGTRLERALNWQIVNLSAPPADWHDAPILFIAGSQALLSLTDADVLKIKSFVEQGGMILGNADCGKEPFADSFRKLGRRMFPGYDFRDLPADHIIFTAQLYPAVNWKNKPKVEALSNGVRELMILVPDADPGRAWQTRADKTKEELFQLATDIVLYSVDTRNLLYKGQTYIVPEGPNLASPSQTLKVARLMAGGNPDPEPGGWRRLRNLLRNNHTLEVAPEPVKLARGALAGFDVAHLTGTTAFKLDDAARKELTGFVRGGGTLLIDAAGGSTGFAQSAEAELTALFGEAATKGLADPLPPEHTVYRLLAAPINEFTYRRFARKVVGTSRAPRVRGITVDGKLRVFYSREDLSAGLVGQSVDGIVGYEPDTATAIMRNVLLFVSASKSGQAPATAPRGPSNGKPTPGIPF